MVHMLCIIMFQNVIKSTLASTMGDLNFLGPLSDTILCVLEHMHTCYIFLLIWF